jgi:hypothetical protein
LVSLVPVTSGGQWQEQASLGVFRNLDASRLVTARQHGNRRPLRFRHAICNSFRQGVCSPMRVALPILFAAGVMVTPLTAGEDAYRRGAGLAGVPGLETPDLRRVADGLAVAKTLDATDPREVVVIGSIALPASREAVVRTLRDILFTQSRVVPQLGRFGATPSAADLQGLSIDESDLVDLQECTADRCKIYLPADVVKALDTARRGSSGHVREDLLSTLFKEFLVNRANGYLTRGKTALSPYAQRTGVNGPAADVESLLAASAPYLNLAPALSRHLRAFPERSPDVEDALYWTKEQFGWKPMIRLTHFAIGPTAARREEPIVAASLQLYASHYIDASLGIVLLLDAGGPGPGCHVIYVNRSRVKAAAGRFGSITRRVIESRARDGLRRFLETLKARAIDAGTAP